MGYPLNEMNFGGKPPHRPGPHGPGHHWNDTECAVEIPPWEDCCGEGDDCLCLTSADTSAWDDVVNTVATNSGAWGGGEPGPSPETSATLWNTSYEIVSSNSAKWEELYNNSAKWNEISAVSGSLKTVVTDNLSILGNGTAANPIRINPASAWNWNAGYKMASFLTSELYEIDGETPRWVDINGLDELNNKVSALTSAWQRNEIVDKQQWAAISRLGGGKGAAYEFRYVKNMDPNNLSEYCEPNVIYYTDQW